MISYPIALKELLKRIDTAHPAHPTKTGKQRANANKSIAWRQRARMATLRLRRKKTYTEGPYGDFWTDLKQIFVKIQGNGKCGYCEKKISHRGRGMGGDIDHFRPKGGVKSWVPRSGVALSTGGDDPECYYLLAFSPSNYVLACKTCNEDLKSNYFPIAGPRCSAHSSNTASLRAEDPYLIHPLDPNEPDPETLIEFQGITAVPRVARGAHNYWRAVVTIEMFGLTKGARLDLDLQRADVIRNLFIALQLDEKDPGNTDAAEMLKLLDENALPHRNCARSFERLYRTDPDTAKQFAKDALEQLKRSGKV